VKAEKKARPLFFSVCYPFLQLCPGQSPLAATLPDKRPELVRVTELDLLSIHPFNTDEQCYGLAIPRDKDALALGIPDTVLQIGRFNGQRSHGNPSVV
jgi:hypothetical protein